MKELLDYFKANEWAQSSADVLWRRTKLGLHFNAALNSGANFSVPSNVLTALYELSDHLPVVLEVTLTAK